MQQIEFDNYLEEIRPLIDKELEKTQRLPKINQNDMLLDHFTENQKNTYYRIQIASMINGKIWEIVFFNFPDWKRIKKMDGKSDTRKTIIELKNKATTLNSASKKGTIQGIKELQKEYPNYRFIIGFINDDSNRNIMDDENEILYLGGDSLFHYVFGERYQKEIQKKVKEIVSSFYDKKYE